MELYLNSSLKTRWSSFENLTAVIGAGGRSNRGVKGSPSAALDPGESRTLLEVKDSGVIRRIWMTVSDRSPEMLRSLRLDLYWDGAETPAVSAPLGDFFGIGLGRTAPFECELFSNPEGRSFHSVLPMPFRHAARMVITNETPRRLAHLFFDVNFEAGAIPDNALYLHAHWRREQPTKLGQDFEILPRIEGAGRFVGSNVGVIAGAEYDGAWWGEGEVKVFLDGDRDWPTLVGTGTEDYIGTGWGQGQFAHRYQGCPIADSKRRQWAFYRYHVPDPVRFSTGCRITIQQIGGAGRDTVVRLQESGVPLVPISVHTGQSLIPLLERFADAGPDNPPRARDLEEGWINFQRVDDWSSTAYFYLDSPQNGLPPLPPAAERARGLQENEATER